jgi:hypothetical protein
LEEEVEESDEREGFSIGGVNGRVGSTRDGGAIDGGITARLSARDRGGVEGFGWCCWKRIVDDEGREVVELVDGRRIRKEESRVETRLGGLASVEWDRVGEQGPEVAGEGDRGDK